MGGRCLVDGGADDGVSGGGVEGDSGVGALRSAAEVVEAVDTAGIDDGAFEGCCDNRLGRVSGIDAPVHLAE